MTELDGIWQQSESNKGLRQNADHDLGTVEVNDSTEPKRKLESKNKLRDAYIKKVNDLVRVNPKIMMRGLYKASELRRMINGNS